MYRDREIEREGDVRGPVTVRVWPRIRIKGEGMGTGYHAFFSGILSVHVFWHFVRIPP